MKKRLPLLLVTLIALLAFFFASACIIQTEQAQESAATAAPARNVERRAGAQIETPDTAQDTTTPEQAETPGAQSPTTEITMPPLETAAVNPATARTEVSAPPATTPAAASASAVASATPPAASPAPQNSGTPAQTELPGVTPPAEPTPAAPVQTDLMLCTVSISCKSALNINPDLINAVSASGVILENKQVAIKKGGSVYDALVATGIQTGGSSNYVSSINSLGENDCGAGSGWMYAVNGKYSGKGANNYVLSDGDAVSWNYTCDNGKDINAYF